MQEVVCTLFRMFGRKGSQPASPYSSASRLSIASLVILGVGCLLSISAAAQVSPQTLTTPVFVKQPLSPEILAIHSRAKRPVAKVPTNLELAATDSAPTTFNSDQGPGPGPIGPGPGCNLFPAPASIGTSVPLSYFGPPPSDTNRSLVGPVQLLDTGVVDVAHGTITIPLYLGHLKGNGKNVWYILTDVDDSDVAAELGLNFSAKLTFAATAARTANFDQNNDLVFDAGTVDFSPVRSVSPGPAGQEFPPTAFNPGSVGDKNYSPFVQVLNAAGVIYNAPIVAFNVNASDITFPNGNVDYSKVHDEVV